MERKIMIIHGSPRKKGNTKLVAELVKQGAEAENACVVDIDVSELEYKIPGCSGCLECHGADGFGCVINDELAKKVNGLVEYDVIIIATPTYWMSYSAQIKMFIDRMGSLMKFSKSGEVRTPLAGKTLALVSTANGDMENNMLLLEEQCRNLAGALSCFFSSCLFPKTLVEPGTLGNDQRVIKKAKEFGAFLASEQ